MPLSGWRQLWLPLPWGGAYDQEASGSLSAAVGSFTPSHTTHLPLCKATTVPRGHSVLAGPMSPAHSGSISASVSHGVKTPPAGSQSRGVAFVHSLCCLRGRGRGPLTPAPLGALQSLSRC